MMTLDERAREASQAITSSVAEYAPRETFDDVMIRHRRSRTAGYAVAGGLAVLVVLAGVWLRGPVPEPDVAVTTTTPVVEEVEPSIDEALPVVPVVPTVPVPDRSEIVEPTVEPTPVEPTPAAAAPEEEDEPIVEEEPADTTPPKLTITSPKDGAVVEEKKLTFTGTSEPGAVVTRGPYTATMKADGDWSITLVLKEGSNGVRFTATDEAGNQTSRKVTVVYKPVKEEPPPPPEVEFTAFATYGTCALDPPYDIYYGTAEPGSKVTITSEWGSGSVTADAEGNWSKKVIFEGAPYNEEFIVTVKDTHGTKKKFEFTAFPPE